MTSNENAKHGHNRPISLQDSQAGRGLAGPGMAGLQRTDAEANTRVLELAKVRKIEIKGK